MLRLLCVTLVLAVSPPSTVRVASLRAKPTIDAKLSDLSAGTRIAGFEVNGAEAFAGVMSRVLYVGTKIPDPDVSAHDVLSLSLLFPGAGPAAMGHTYLVSVDGKRATDTHLAPSHAWKQVQARARRAADGFEAELAIPFASLPPFPARGPLVLDACITYGDVSNCSGGAMRGSKLELGDETRAQLKLSPPSTVVSLERRPTGWLGRNEALEAVWARADTKIRPDTLAHLITDEPLDAHALRFAMPKVLALKGAPALVPVLSGKDPFSEDGSCSGPGEVKLAIYAVERDGRAAQQVLSWPLVSCRLGRGMSLTLEPDGTLVIGYSTGVLVTFAWSGKRFERTEVGAMPRNAPRRGG